MREIDIQQAIRAALGREPDLVLWRNPVGVDSKHGQRYGLCVGSSDLVGIGPGGRFFCLEVKSFAGRVSPEQEMFLQLVRRRHGFAAVVRSVEEAREALDRCRAGKLE